MQTFNPPRCFIRRDWRDAEWSNGDESGEGVFS